jgi:pyruvate-formate lyase
MLQAGTGHKKITDVIHWPYGSGVANHKIRPSARTIKLLEQYHDWKLSLGYETLYWWTKTHRRTEGEPQTLRRAKSLYAFTENVSLCIQPRELIVGIFECQPRCFSPTPDVDSDGTWLMNELDNLSTRFPDPIFVDETTRAHYKELLPYWNDKTMHAIWHRDMAAKEPGALAIRQHGGTAAYLASFCHMHLGYDTLIQKGIRGLKKEIETLKAGLKPDSPNFKEKSIFYDSCLIVCDAYSTFAKRYAMHAENLSISEKDETLRANYIEVAEICGNVATRPVGSFHEALQAIWFAQLLAVVESGLTAFGFGRMDQYLYPYYKKDMETGNLTREKAQELLDSFWIKTAEPVLVLESVSSKSVAGQPLGQQLDIAGVDENGNDATNDLSYMMLQASMNTRLIQPTVGVLWHRNMPDELAKMAVELTSLGTGHPSHFSSDTMVDMLKKVGLSEEEARQGCLIGCLEPSGKQGTTQSNC